MIDLAAWRGRSRSPWTPEWSDGSLVIGAVVGGEVKREEADSPQGAEDAEKEERMVEVFREEMVEFDREGNALDWLGRIEAAALHWC
ncbi:MAG TPA: hypothetical protein VG797_02995 [Phycisphaerales bacterium]|nr:hypothetical protein [Phycisphaerales bacterium]